MSVQDAVSSAIYLFIYLSIYLFLFIFSPAPFFPVLVCFLFPSKYPSFLSSSFFLFYSRLYLFKAFVYYCFFPLVYFTHISQLRQTPGITVLNTTYEQRTINARLFSVMPVLFSFSALKFHIIRDNLMSLVFAPCSP